MEVMLVLNTPAGGGSNNLERKLELLNSFGVSLLVTKLLFLVRGKSWNEVDESKPVVSVI
jgi:hypothetical protein